MRLKAILAFAIIATISVLQLGSQSMQPGISITDIPAWGQDGQINGFVYGPGSQQALVWVFAFVPDMGWMGLPGLCAPMTVPNGRFSTNAAPNVILRQATRFSVYLVPATLHPSCAANSASIPFIIQHNAIASATYPRLPRYSTITFGGLEWYIKDAPIQVYPGPQFFIRENAYLDSSGQLHLRISRCGDSWCSAEIYTKEAVGYGSYRFNIASPLNNLDPNVTLGLFSWDGQAGEQNNREWDIEFCRWGNAVVPFNSQYVVQPYNTAGNLQRFTVISPNPSTHTVSWTPSQVSFVSTANNTPIAQWASPGVRRLFQFLEMPTFI
jgi:hypothetical protein